MYAASHSPPRGSYRGVRVHIHKKVKTVQTAETILGGAERSQQGGAGQMKGSTYVEGSEGSSDQAMVMPPMRASTDRLAWGAHTGTKSPQVAPRDLNACSRQWMLGDLLQGGSKQLHSVLSPVHHPSHTCGSSTSHHLSEESAGAQENRL